MKGNLPHILWWPVRFISFLCFYSLEVLLSNVRVAYDVLTPSHHMKPGFVAIPLERLTEQQVLVLANLITMTPGTLSLDVSTDRTTLYLHAMFIEDVESLRSQIVNVYEHKVRELF